VLRHLCPQPNLNCRFRGFQTRKIKQQQNLTKQPTNNDNPSKRRGGLGGRTSPSMALVIQAHGPQGGIRFLADRPRRRMAGQPGGDGPGLQKFGAKGRFQNQGTSGPVRGLTKSPGGNKELRLHITASLNAGPFGRDEPHTQLNISGVALSNLAGSRVPSPRPHTSLDVGNLLIEKFSPFLRPRTFRGD